VCGYSDGPAGFGNRCAGGRERLRRAGSKSDELHAEPAVELDELAQVQEEFGAFVVVHAESFGQRAERSA
jgi:hypothetical protein